jgi:serine protease Do
MLALSGLVLAACSPNASTAGPPVQVTAPAMAAAAVTTAPLVTGLPDFTPLVERYGPAVVNVQVTEKRPQRNGQEDILREQLRRFGIEPPETPRGESQPRGEGSGFIVTPDGYILTNAHVVRDAVEVQVKMTDRREYRATVIGLDDRTDVAVIKIDGKNLPTVRIGDPESLRPGQWVVAIGSPFGMENSVTAGIVSATSRRLPNEQYVPFIQTDVAVNPGNSGGPLFNLNGEVVGINSQIYSQSGGYMGLSFAIPIDMANNVREQLVKYGKVTRGRIGVQIQPVDAAFAESFGLDRPRGALVGDVVKGEPADKAGIVPGDIILSVDGKQVESDVSLPVMISGYQPGSSAELEVWRDRKLRKVTVKVVEIKDENTTAAVVPGERGRGGSGGGNRGEVAPVVRGMTVHPLTPEEKEQAGTSGSLVVIAVTGAGEKAGVQRGDIILGVQGVPVKTVAELQAAEAKSAGKTISLRLQRGEAVTFLAVRPE